MFGRMQVSTVTQVEPEADLKTAIAPLLAAAEQADIIRWIEFPLTLLLFLMVPGDPASGAAYILDRKKGTWYAVDFEDEQFGGYTSEQLEQLLQECGLLTLVEQPGLWRGGLRWSLEAGKPPGGARLTASRVRVINQHRAAARNVLLGMEVKNGWGL